MSKVILNAGGGKIKPIGINPNDFLINLDGMYLVKSSFHHINYQYNEYLKDPKNFKEKEYFSDMDIFEFLENWLYYFDLITMYRFLEHIKRNDILYFIYLLSTSTKIGSEIDIIVPNYISLAKRIIDEDPFSKDFVKEDIITSTELFNEPEMPHCSIWTPLRAKYYFELEGRFKVTNIIPKFEFDGRDIYLRFTATRF